MYSPIQRSISASVIPVLVPVAGSPTLSTMVKVRPMRVSRNPSRFSERATRSAWVVGWPAISVLPGSALLGGCGRVLQGGNEFPTLQVRKCPRHRGDELPLYGAGGYQPCELVGDCCSVGLSWCVHPLNLPSLWRAGVREICAEDPRRVEMGAERHRHHRLHHHRQPSYPARPCAKNRTRRQLIIGACALSGYA